jgi:hypothetical protein
MSIQNRNIVLFCLGGSLIESWLEFWLFCSRTPAGHDFLALTKFNGLEEVASEIKIMGIRTVVIERSGGRTAFPHIEHS